MTPFCGPRFETCRIFHIVGTRLVTVWEKFQNTGFCIDRQAHWRKARYQGNFANLFEHNPYTEAEQNNRSSSR